MGSVLRIKPGRLELLSCFFESSEPPFDVLPFAELLKLYPEGEYTFAGKTVKGEEVSSKATFTHKVPVAPRVKPAAGSVTDPKNTVISWKRVKKPRGINIAGYEVIVRA